MAPLMIDGESLDIDGVVRIGSDRSSRIAISDAARDRCEVSHKVIRDIVASGEAAYGITTGFGALARVRIDTNSLEQLQRNLIWSHAAGVGKPLDDEIVRATVLLRLNTLAKGFSGVSQGLLDLLTEMVNRDVVPVIPDQGSLGASGDLAPLAHLSLVLMGEGEARVGGRLMSGGDALTAVGLSPITLGPKEGLALINGTPVMTALACYSVSRSLNLLRSANVVAALSTEALRGTDAAFSEALQRLRPHPGQSEVARVVRAMLADSEVMQSHRDCGKVQDPYSIRCIPQVHGACLDAWAYSRRVVAIEVNSATDNPLIVDGRVLTGGNFHGEPIGMAMDLLAIALCELGSISERRVARLTNAHLSDLPAFLVANSGLNSGMMIPHYTAAALVMESRLMSHPATVDSLPTSADQEDHVSMAFSAAKKTFQIMNNLANVLAIELVCVAQGLDFLQPLKAGRGAQAAYECVRSRIKHLDQDRRLTPDLDAARHLILSGELARVAESAAGVEFAPNVS